MAKDAIDVIMDIITSEMDLDDDQVILYNQKWNIPATDGLFIVVSLISQTAYAAKKCYESREAVGDDPAGLYEIQTLNKNSLIGIDIFSKDESARTRQDEVVLALNSTYAQQQSEAESISIAPLPQSMSDISEVEAAARLNRYKINFRVFSAIKKEKIVEYYDTFSLETYRSL